MKLFWTCAGALLLAASIVSAQSPAATETKSIGGKTITIKYASPRVNNRAGKLFGKDGRIGQDPNYPIWRAGANAATSLVTDADLVVAGLAVPKGSYTLYVNLANPESWELVISKQTGQWGLKYDPAQDLGRVKMQMSKPPAMVEELKYTIADAGGNKGTITLQWENKIASVPFTVK